MAATDSMPGRAATAWHWSTAADSIHELGDASTRTFEEFSEDIAKSLWCRV